MIAEVRTTPEHRATAVQQLLRRQRLRRALEDYEKFIRIKAFEFARSPHEREDFEQEGRIAVWRAVTALEAKQDKGSHRYFRVAINRAMIDYWYKVYRRNCQVWRYTGPPPKVERYRYRGELKARVRFHPAKVERVVYQYEPQPSLDAPGGKGLLQDFARCGGKRTRSSDT
jgi:DNA-directed RNA polymerase specialized sigma24 family protein